MATSTGAPETLLLHGFLGSRTDFPELTDNYIAPDLPGHGDSVGLPEDAYTMEGAAHYILEALSRETTGIIRLVGYSMGGRLALFLALKHPERFSHLVLESASPGLRTEEERAARKTSDENLARRLEAANDAEFRSFLEEWHRQPLFASLASHEGMAEHLIHERLNNDPEELAKSLRGMGTGSQPSLWGELYGLKVPTLAVVGEYDAKFRRIAREMAECSSNITVEVVDGAGHNVHTERPEEFVRLLKRHVGAG